MEHHDNNDSSQIKSEQDHTLPFLGGQIIDRHEHELAAHPDNSLMILDRSIRCETSVKLPSSSSQGPNHILPDTCLPTSASNLAAVSIHSSNKNDNLKHFISTSSEGSSSVTSLNTVTLKANDDSNISVIDSILQELQYSTETHENISISTRKTLIQMLLSDTSIWDLMILKATKEDVNGTTSNDQNYEKKALDCLISNTEEVLRNLCTLICDNFDISAMPEECNDDTPCILEDSSIYVSGQLANAIYQKEEVKDGDQFMYPVSNVSRGKLKLFVKDSNKLHGELQTAFNGATFHPIFTNPENNENVKLIKGNLDKISTYSKNDKTDTSTSKEASLANEDDHMHSKTGNNLESLSKMPCEGNGQEIRSFKTPNRTRTRTRSKKRGTTDSSRQQATIPPPRPIIREDGKKIYKKAKVISGYFAHYPVSEEQYKNVIQQGDPFICPPCQRQFKHRRSWEHHLNGRCLGMPLIKPKWYKRDGKFFCSHDGCANAASSNRGWTTSYMVWVHFYRVHSPGGQLPHKCDLCDNSFAKVAQLRIHKESKHNINRKVHIIIHIP